MISITYINPIFQVCDLRHGLKIVNGRILRYVSKLANKRNITISVLVALLLCLLAFVFLLISHNYPVNQAVGATPEMGLPAEVNLDSEGIHVVSSSSEMVRVEGKVELHLLDGAYLIKDISDNNLILVLGDTVAHSIGDTIKITAQLSYIPLHSGTESTGLSYTHLYDEGKLVKKYLHNPLANTR